MLGAETKKFHTCSDFTTVARIFDGVRYFIYLNVWNEDLII